MESGGSSPGAALTAGETRRLAGLPLEQLRYELAQRTPAPVDALYLREIYDCDAAEIQELVTAGVFEVQLVDDALGSWFHDTQALLAYRTHIQDVLLTPPRSARRNGLRLPAVLLLVAIIALTAVIILTF